MFNIPKTLAKYLRTSFDHDLRGTKTKNLTFSADLKVHTVFRSFGRSIFNLQSTSVLYKGLFSIMPRSYTDFLPTIVAYPSQF